MVESLDSVTRDLPAVTARVIRDFVEAARRAFGADLRSIILYGSGAEGRLRATSDVNLILLLSVYDRGKADLLREPLRTAQAAVRLAAMFLLESELGVAMEAFAVKFSDILHRRRVLFGVDPFDGISVSKGAAIARLKQVLLNLRLRLRSFYVLRSLREEQLALVIADAAGPLRSSAATLLELEGQPAESPREALDRVVTTLEGSGWMEVLGRLSEAREHRLLPPGTAARTLFRLLELTQRIEERVKRLS